LGAGREGYQDEASGIAERSKVCPGPCPTVYEDLDDPTSLVIRGYLTETEGVAPPPAGEGDLRVPRGLIVEAATRLRAAQG
jgi:hypothetical protein